MAEYCQVRPFGEKYATTIAGAAGRTAISPEPSEPRPLMVFSAPWPSGTVTCVHADPPSVLSQVPDPPLLSAPEITVSSPLEAA